VSDASSTAAPAATPSSVLPEVPRLPDRLVDQLAFPSRATYKEMVAAFRQAGFELCADLCAVDYLTHPGRTLPEGVQPERFEVVVNLLSLSMRQRVRVRVQVPESDPAVDSLFDVYPGTEAMEREAYDMVTPTSRASSCPRTGRATRCARTTASAGCPCNSRKPRGHDE
jgi:NADH:ubiquinone oxidoreductase subunit C